MGTPKTRPWNNLLARVASTSLIFVVSLGTVTAAVAQQSVAPQANAPELPDSPGATLARLQQAAPQQGAVQPQSSGTDSITPIDPQTVDPQSAEPQSPRPQVQSPPPRPDGTAAAEAAQSTGVPVSQPAGVAIAPAKQRRARTIWLRTGAIIGAGVALGSVVALSSGTSSKPPGAH